EVRITAVDEDVSAREMRGELLDGALDRSGGHHDPYDSPRGQLPNHVGEVIGALGAFGDMSFDRIGARVVHDQLVPALGQSLHHVAAHTAQPDHRQLHCCSLSGEPTRTAPRESVKKASRPALELGSAVSRQRDTLPASPTSLSRRPHLYLLGCLRPPVEPCLEVALESLELSAELVSRPSPVGTSVERRVFQRRYHFRHLRLELRDPSLRLLELALCAAQLPARVLLGF